MDAILTAIVIRSPKELSKDKELLKARRDAGQVTTEAFAILEAVIAKAEAGNWANAEQELYEIRKDMPFPQ